ncbi:Pectinesterase protein [Dioscorea alata]|uniref:Pectinesterase protein n=1 Tax=Dioscorea alata TaxID=55571 RepID=A0ACB7VYG7_DIOAL|nr:Pectinesterase protein [Dioscorea alata]
MSAFQDFGPLTERRKAERQQSRRKKLMIIGSSIGVLAVVAVIGVAAVVQHTGGSEGDSDPASGSHKQLHSASRSVEMICSSTDYKKTCEKSLSKTSNSTSSPKDLIKAAVKVIFDEASKAFGQSQLFKSDDERVKGAVLVCQELLNSTKDSLTRTLNHLNVDTADKLVKQRRALKSWLATVMTNTETCVDAFPEGPMKTKMRKGMQTAKQMTSNALVIIQEPEFHPDGMPSWITESDRRLLKQQAASIYTPNVTVAKDGSGNFTTITEALNAIPTDRDTAYVLSIKQGLYEENVTVESWMTNITMYGEGSRKTIITGNKSHRDGVQTYHTSTLTVVGDSFMGVALGIQNTAGPDGEQAVALRVNSDVSIFLNCRMDGYQDTLYAYSNRQYYRGCVITGTVDFIFGDATAVIQNSVITIRKPKPNQQNIITAQGRTDKREDTGLVIHKCRITTEPGAETFPNYLARPWKFKSRTFGNTGPGADTSKRVKWQGVKNLTKAAAEKFTPANFIDAGDWIKKTGVPVQLSFYNN